MIQGLDNGRISVLDRPADVDAAEIQSATPSRINATQLLVDFPSQREPIIDGLIRRGETMNLIASPKIGKSWLTLGLAFSISNGRDWLAFPTTAGRVLIIDNELHVDTLAHRLRKVSSTTGLECQGIDVLPLRGLAVDFNRLPAILQDVVANEYSLIVLDAFYRFLPGGISENDNAAMMGIFNTLDGVALQTGAAIVNVHHASKGSQADKSITDVGSGAGAISRAADTHLTLRPHELADHVVLDAVCRSFPPHEPRTITWQFPIWQSTEIEPVLKTPKSGQDRRQEKQDIETTTKLVEAIKSLSRATVSTIRSKVPFGPQRIQRGLGFLMDADRITSTWEPKGQSGKSIEVFSVKS